ncbi:hypothetical protein [Bacillus sp. USDA818B3_A]|uniref:hypothetical protein n=1 Tax=Bacillus sp. USDA818B3_A TaxID=2698834 RepID=UPI00136E4FA1|nr:hypothetical protein [Bacillus sp. USDA818B3_A]
MIDPNNKEWMDQLRNSNDQQFSKLLNDQMKKRKQKKYKEELKKSQEEALQSLKDKYTAQPSSPLADMLTKMLNQKR